MPHHEHQPRSASEEIGDISQLNLKEVNPLDFDEPKTISEMLHAFAEQPFGNREVGEAADLLEEMVRDPDMLVVCSISGAMIPGGMGRGIQKMVDMDMFQALDTTGATIAHGFVEQAGMHHYFADPNISDSVYADLMVNRIHRVLELESNLYHVEEIMNSIFQDIEPNRVTSSRYFTQVIGKYLYDNNFGVGMLRSAYEKGVPVTIPAFFDSEIGLDVDAYDEALEEKGLPAFNYNDLQDWYFYKTMIREAARRGNKFGIFTIGGGVPRNFVQQIGPDTEILADRFKKRNPGMEPPSVIMFDAAIRFDPSNVNLGGLSGCTYEEGKSWRKFRKDAKTVEVLHDALVTWPWVLAGVLERLKEKPAEPKRVYAGPEAVAEVARKTDKRFNPHLFED